MLKGTLTTVLAVLPGIAVLAVAVPGCGSGRKPPVAQLDGARDGGGADLAAEAGDATAGSSDTPRSDAGPEGAATIFANPEEYWLRRVGTGTAQTGRVCDRDRGDPVARTLCGPSGSAIAGLTDLYRVLDLPPTTRGGADLALSNSSSGLSFRMVSPLNPRVFAMAELHDANPLTGTAVVTAFSRGEQQVELLGYDRETDTLRLYLLTFTQDCNEQGGCDAEHLLGEAVERDWRSWTLYEAEDLVDTPLDCLACHQPAAQGPRRALMRDAPSPWFHWFPSASELPRCLSDASLAAPNLRGLFQRAHPAGYGGQDALSLADRANGHNLHSVLVLLRGAARLDAEEPFLMPSLEIVDELLCSQSNSIWLRYRAATLLERGFPIPSYAFESLDPVRAAPAMADYPAFLRQHAKEDPFHLMAGLLSDDHQRAVGAWPDPALDGDGILREMCTRCHDDRAPAGSMRSRFNVRALTAAAAAVALERIALPVDSPYAMPPRRAGALPPPELAKLRSFLQSASSGGP